MMMMMMMMGAVCSVSFPRAVGRVEGAKGSSFGKYREAHLNHSFLVTGSRLGRLHVLLAAPFTPFFYDGHLLDASVLSRVPRASGTVLYVYEDGSGRSAVVEPKDQPIRTKFTRSRHDVGYDSVGHVGS